ncbi:mannonate dehydratase [Candidatus Poribacteria bacterium]
MVKIALTLGPQPGPGHILAKQCGIEYAVGGIGLNPKPNASKEEQPWSHTSLARAKKAYKDAGFELAVIESRPPMEKAKLGLPGRDEQIAVVCELIRNMGAVGIPVWCPAWMPILMVLRTSRTIPSRGGALVTGYDHREMDDSLTERGVITEEEQWDALKYFLERVVPVAEEANVKLAMHPDDPPLSPIRGVARIMSSIENYQKLIDLVPSPVNGIALCQGNFTLMTDDLPAAIRHFGGQKKIFFVHFRDVRGTPDNFAETFHDDGKTDMAECMRAYRDVGYDIIARPDHYPKMGNEEVKDNYGLARLFAIGYLRGLQDAVHSELK